MGGANFASAGAGALAETHSGFVVDLKSQLRQFEKIEKQLKKNFGDELAAKTISEAVYMFSIGGNDYGSPFFTNSTLFQSHSHEQYVAMVIGNLTSVISGIHSKGGRKFGVNSLGPLGCHPVMRALEGTGACSKELNELVKLHNGALAKALQKFQGRQGGMLWFRSLQGKDKLWGEERGDRVQIVSEPLRAHLLRLQSSAREGQPVLCRVDVERKHQCNWTVQSGRAV
ncbi:hypothetical protein CRG98_023044 [Punica granatum]|uniref:GDSL esterase/lipase 5-like n=1 Tax=Punica granatum TaxID=22663 RepID=A0A2I0JJS2_PUNGR|nr:hypothetical protein CRG98_023044 [Punica granatum]